MWSERPIGLRKLGGLVLRHLAVVRVVLPRFEQAGRAPRVGICGRRLFLGRADGGEDGRLLGRAVLQLLRRRLDARTVAAWADVVFVVRHLRAGCDLAPSLTLLAGGLVRVEDV